MKSDEDKWDARFAGRDDQPGAPDEFLVRHVDGLRPGAILDLACGDGRNALFLAERGFEVCGVDVSAVGLERLRRFAARRGLRVSTLKRDLDDLESLEDLGPFDDVVISHFKPPEGFWRRAQGLLVEGGVLAFFTFSTRQHERHGFPRRLCIEPGELLDTPPPGLSCLHHEEYGAPERHLEGYLFERRTG